MKKDIAGQAVLEAAERCVTYLKERYGVKRAIVFGSARGENPWHEGSDLDLAVEGLAPEVFFRAFSELYQLLPRGIILDLVPLEDVSPELYLRILGEVEMVELRLYPAMDETAPPCRRHAKDLRYPADSTEFVVREDSG